MGQYHCLVNLDKKEYVSPHRLGLGAKQREHNGPFDGSLADALYLLTIASPARGGGDWALTPISGAWAGNRVAVLGDYTEDGDLPDSPEAGNLYGAVDASDGEWTDISDKVADAFTSIFGIRFTSDTMRVHGLAGQRDFVFWKRIDQ